MSKFPAIGHLALTVSDLDASTSWYNRVFDTEPAFEMSFDNFDRRVYALPGGQVLGITRHKSGNPGRFDPTVVGLDHVGFSCGDLAELEAWAGRLAELGDSLALVPLVVVARSPEATRWGPARRRSVFMVGG